MTALAGTQADEPTRKSRRKPVGVDIADAFGIADQQRVIAPAAGLCA
jgi:hypothetical protein